MKSFKKSIVVSLAIAPALFCLFMVITLLINMSGYYYMLDCHYGWNCTLEPRKYKEAELWAWLLMGVMAAGIGGLLICEEAK